MKNLTNRYQVGDDFAYQSSSCNEVLLTKNGECFTDIDFLYRNNTGIEAIKYNTSEGKVGYIGFNGTAASTYEGYMILGTNYTNTRYNQGKFILKDYTMTNGTNITAGTFTSSTTSNVTSTVCNTTASNSTSNTSSNATSRNSTSNSSNSTNSTQNCSQVTTP